jgi:hypothetical protein
VRNDISYSSLQSAFNLFTHTILICFCLFPNILNLSLPPPPLPPPKKIGLLSLCYNCVSHFFNDIKIFISFSQHTLSDPPPFLRTFPPDPTPYLPISQNAFHDQIFSCSSVVCCNTVLQLAYSQKYRVI